MEVQMTSGLFREENEECESEQRMMTCWRKLEREGDVPMRKQAWNDRMLSARILTGSRNNGRRQMS